MDETTKSALARELGVSHVRIQQYLQLGLPVLPNGKLKRRDALAWIVANVGPDDDRSKAARKAAELLTGQTYSNLTPSGGINDHKLRLLKARADLAEMEAAQLSGQLVRTEQVESVWAEAMVRVRQRMLSVAPKAAPVVAVETNADTCHEIIEAFVHEALAEVAGTEIEASDSEEVFGTDTCG